MLDTIKHHYGKEKIVRCLGGLWVTLTGIVLLFLFTCCDDSIQVKQIYTFDIETLPVQKKIGYRETAEIRCTLIREGVYEETEFFIRYFQPDGKGELRLEDGTVLVPNDLFPLKNEVFRLYYTSHSTDQQTIDVYFVDSHGQIVLKTFSFQNESNNPSENQ